MDSQDAPNNRIVKFRDTGGQESWGQVSERKGGWLEITVLLPPSAIKEKSTMKTHYTGKKELYKTNRRIMISTSDIIERYPELSLETYPESTGFLVRTSVTDSKKIIDIPNVCVCQEPLNPDTPYNICNSCSSIFHKNCLENSNICPHCAHPLKRMREESLEKKVRNEKVVIPIDLKKYKALSEESKTRVHEKASVLDTQTSGLPPEERIRQGIVNKIVCALYVAQEENSLELTPCTAKTLAMEIESALFVSTGSSASSKEYKTKVRALLFNLTDEKNTDFRMLVANGSIKASNVASMESRDMASGELKNFRNERQKKYEEEQLVLAESAEIVLFKSRKGDVVIEKEDGNHFKSLVSEDDPFNPNTYQDDKHGDLRTLAKEWMHKVVSARISNRIQQYLLSDAERLLTKSILQTHLNKS